MIGRKRSRRQIAQAQQQARELQLELDAFEAGYLQAQRRASGDETLGPDALEERLKAGAAYYIGQLYRAANPSIGERVKWAGPDA